MTALILAAILPFWEMRIVDRVADRYSLTVEQKHLLCAIRRAENGTRYYYGVVDPRCVGYEAQCRWCANTIRLRYDGDVEKFAVRWNVNDTKNWTRNVRFFIRKQISEELMKLRVGKKR